MSSPFRALRSRNYRLFFIGQGISLIGSWMTRLATSWLVYRLTDSEFLLGVVAFAGQAPSLILPPLACTFGVVASSSVPAISSALAALLGTLAAFAGAVVLRRRTSR